MLHGRRGLKASRISGFVMWKSEGVFFIVSTCTRAGINGEPIAGSIPSRGPILACGRL